MPIFKKTFSEVNYLGDKIICRLKGTALPTHIIFNTISDILGYFTFT